LDYPTPKQSLVRILRFSARENPRCALPILAVLSAVNRNGIILKRLTGLDRAKSATTARPKAAMTKEEEREFRGQLARLQQEHRDLDAAIAALQDSPGADVIQVQRLKKRKLQLRDRITFIEDQLTPDIIA
jgi:hypothetical protein